MTDSKIKYVSTKLTLPKYPGMYDVKIKLPDGSVCIDKAEYVTLSDDNLDWDLENYSEDSEVIAFSKIKD
jgi:hypothetical protein